MTENERQELFYWKRKAQQLEEDLLKTLRNNGDELEPQKEYHAQWPEHDGCLLEPKIGTYPWVLCSRVAHGEILYTGPHKLNMVPHNGGPRPVSAEQTIVVQFRDGEYGAASAKAFRWQHGNNNVDIVYYCPIDPVRVDL